LLFFCSFLFFFILFYFFNCFHSFFFILFLIFLILFLFFFYSFFLLFFSFLFFFYSFFILFFLFALFKFFYFFVLFLFFLILFCFFFYSFFFILLLLFFYSFFFLFLILFFYSNFFFGKNNKKHLCCYVPGVRTSLHPALPWGGCTVPPGHPEGTSAFDRVGHREKPVPVRSWSSVHPPRDAALPDWTRSLNGSAWSSPPGWARRRHLRHGLRHRGPGMGGADPRCGPGRGTR